MKFKTFWQLAAHMIIKIFNRYKVIGDEKSISYLSHFHACPYPLPVV
jgi:hypothetical protein